MKPKMASGIIIFAFFLGCATNKNVPCQVAENRECRGKDQERVSVVIVDHSP